MTPALRTIKPKEAGKGSRGALLILRVIVASAVLLSTQLGITLINRGFSPLPPVMPEWHLADFPLQLGSWKGTDVPLNKRVFARSTARSMVNRLYTDPLIGQVTVHLALWDEYRITLPHSPDDCYTRAGWQLVENRSIQVKQNETESFPARIITFDRQSERIAVLFWYETDDSILIYRGGIRRAMQRARLQNAPLPVIFKSMLQTNNDQRAEERLRALAREVRSAKRSLGGKKE